MKIRSAVLIIAISLLATVATLGAQTDEVKLPAAKSKITSVSAMRVRRSPQTSAEEITRLKLGTVVSAVARSANQDTVASKSDYWYRVSLPNGESGWLFGGLLLDYKSAERDQLLKQIIDDRLKAEKTEFADRQEIYNLAANSIAEARDANTRGEFELLKVLALRNWAGTLPDDLKDKSPYREWLKTHGASFIPNEFGGGYELRTEVLWNLETKYHTLPVGERIAWEAAENPQPSDCESDDVCNFFLLDGEIKYLGLHPKGAHAAEAVKNLNEGLTDDVIKEAKSKSGDKYAVQQRAELRKTLTSLRLALGKVTAPEKSELLRKLGQ